MTQRPVSPKPSDKCMHDRPVHQFSEVIALSESSNSSIKLSSFRSRVGWNKPNSVFEVRTSLVIDTLLLSPKRGPIPPMPYTTPNGGFHYRNECYAGVVESVKDINFRCYQFPHFDKREASSHSWRTEESPNRMGQFDFSREQQGRTSNKAPCLGIRLLHTGTVILLDKTPVKAY